MSAPEKLSLYVSGVLHDRALRGERPSYGYPPAPLPETKGESREVQTAFFAGRKALEPQS
jgi:hypothetical protein